LFETHRGLLRAIRGLLRPILKLFFNPDRVTTALNLQSQINTQAEQRLRRIEDREMLSYELLHNMTLEVTRLGIEVHNMKMRVESLSSRVDFDERRSKALEGVVQYRTPPARRAAGVAPAGGAGEPVGEDGDADGAGGPAGERRRRRRRRRRRPGSTMADGQGQNWTDQPAGENGADVDDGAAVEPEPKGPSEQ